MLEERVPPQSIDAEQSVLGAMLIDNAAIAQVTEIISASDFYREAHRVIFDAMMKLYAKNEAVDLITITDVLRRENKMDDVGGIAYITSLANAVPTAANESTTQKLFMKNPYCVKWLRFPQKLLPWATKLKMK